MSTLRICVVFVVGLLGAAGSLRPPNFLVFLADDLGFGDLQSYGHPVSRTPQIDALAAEGLRFTDFYSASPVCSPSRAGIMTGRLMPRTGVYCANGTSACADPEQTSPQCCNGVFLPGMAGGLPLSERTVAAALRDSPARYATMAVGKWHLGMDDHMPTRFGFDHYYGVPHGLGACPCTDCFAGRGAGAAPRPCWTPDGGASADKPGCRAEWAPCPVYRDERIVQQPANLLSLGDQYVGAASAFIANYSHSQGGRPWFLYYCSHHVHSPQFAGGGGGGGGGAGSARGDFGESLAELDRNVGRLLEAVRAAGQADNTLVFFTSDNGPSLRNGVRGGSAGLLKCGKGTTYEGGQRVPAIARWPGRVAPGRTTHAVASGLDILPTLLDLAGVAGAAAPAAAAPLDGYSMRHILLEAADQGDDAARAGAGAGVGAGTALGERAGRLVYYPQLVQRARGAYAARAGAYKAHFATQGSLQCGSNNTDSDCRPDRAYVRLATPLVFNLELDPAEQLPLDPASAEYAVGLAAARAVLAGHERTLQWYPVPLLDVGSFNRTRQPCCRPGCSPFPSCCRCDRLNGSSTDGAVLLSRR
eukprot:g5705.t1